MHMAENGFCKDGEQEEWLANGWSEIGGKMPVNTDGGCLACGEPIGASGLRQVYENVEQCEAALVNAKLKEPERDIVMFMAPQG